MKRALALLVGGVLILGSALAAHAQAPTVSFGGQMRVYGFAIEQHHGLHGQRRDRDQPRQQSFYFQRWRLFTTSRAPTRRPRPYWALEVGDITWGTGGGAYGERAPSAARAGAIRADRDRHGTARGAGATAGYHAGNGQQPGATTSHRVTAPVGVSVPTVSTSRPRTSTSGSTPGSGCQGRPSTLGIQQHRLHERPARRAFDGRRCREHQAQHEVSIRSTSRSTTAKLGEGNNANADDTDAYASRVGVNVTKEIRVTLEGMLLNENSMPGQNLGDTFWIGATASAKLGDVQLDGAFVYGQRAYIAAPGASCGNQRAKRLALVRSFSRGFRSARSTSTRWAGTLRATRTAHPDGGAQGARLEHRQADGGLRQAADALARGRMVQRRRRVHG